MLVSDLWVAGVVDCVVGDRFLVKSIPPSLAFDPDGAWVDREGGRWRWPWVIGNAATIYIDSAPTPAAECVAHVTVCVCPKCEATWRAQAAKGAHPHPLDLRKASVFTDLPECPHGCPELVVHEHLDPGGGARRFRPRPVDPAVAAALAQVEIVPAKRPSEADAIRAERARVWKAAEVAGAAEHAARTAARCPMTALHDLAETCSWGADVVKAGLPHLEARELFFDELSEDPRWDPVAVSVAKDLSDRHVFEIIRNAEGLGDPNATEGKCGVQSLEWARLIHLSVGEQRKTMVRAANLHTETLGRFLKACACALGDSNVQAAEGGAQ